MKAEINLLPPQFQAARRAARYWHGLEHILRRLLVALLIVAIMFGATYLAFRRILTDTQIIQQETGTDPKLEQRVVQTNELLTATATRLQAINPWTPHVGEVLQVLPPELTLVSIAASDESKSLTINGTSRSRPAVLAFEQAVGALPWVERVESPLQNFATGGGTSFTLIITREDTP